MLTPKRTAEVRQYIYSRTVDYSHLIVTLSGETTNAAAGVPTPKRTADVWQYIYSQTVRCVV